MQECQFDELCGLRQFAGSWTRCFSIQCSWLSERALLFEQFPAFARWWRVWSFGGMIRTGKTRSIRSDTCSIADNLNYIHRCSTDCSVDLLLCNANPPNAHFSNKCFNSIFEVFYMFRTPWVHLQEDSSYTQCVRIHSPICQTAYPNACKYILIIKPTRCTNFSNLFLE
jgi:hypothetical protein